jgi:hypothetical protein
MIDEETIKKLNEWIEDKERCFDTSHTDGQYSISQLELDDFCDFLTENEPDLIGIPCMVCAQGIYFEDEDLNNAIHY